MINPYIARELRRAQRKFDKSGRSLDGYACIVALGDMADSTSPDETEAKRLIHLAFDGDPIHA